MISKTLGIKRDYLKCLINISYGASLKELIDQDIVSEKKQLESDDLSPRPSSQLSGTISLENNRPE
jgi:hypothetical protein